MIARETVMITRLVTSSAVALTSSLLAERRCVSEMLMSCLMSVWVVVCCENRKLIIFDDGR